jgi:hypothetical protein
MPIILPPARPRCPSSKWFCNCRSRKQRKSEGVRNCGAWQLRTEKADVLRLRAHQSQIRSWIPLYCPCQAVEYRVLAPRVFVQGQKTRVESSPYEFCSRTHCPHAARSRKKRRIVGLESLSDHQALRAKDQEEAH